MFTSNREKIYDVRDVLQRQDIGQVGDATPGFANSFTDGVDPANLQSGPMNADFEQRSGVLYSGKESFTDTTAGYRLGIDDADNIFKFRIGNSTEYIYWDGSNLVIEGGLVVDELHVPDQDSTANSFHVNTDGDAWWGATETNFNSDNDNANAYVLKTGVAKFQSVTLNGSVIIGALSSGSLPSIQGWQFDGAFSASDSNTVAWGAGTLRFANGETRAISGGNTGNMSSRQYIYYDEDFSTTQLQNSSTASNAVGLNKILVAVAENESDEAFFQVFGGIGGFLVTADEVAANAIVANSINVSSLSAINADMGSITAGTVTIDTSGYVRGGSTDYLTGTGFFLGYSGGAYKFSVGNPSGNYVAWDGSSLTINGYNQTTKGSFGGDGSDGALAISSGTTTIDASGARYVIKNYTSISITGTAKLTISNKNNAGTVLILKSQGDVTITSSATPVIDMDGMGASGRFAAGDDSYSSPFGDAIGGGSQATAAGGVAGSAAHPNADLESGILVSKMVLLAPGAGGGGGQSGGGTNGAGGNGGGVLYIECAGSLNLTATSGISCDGATGVAGTSGGGGGGGGGGGVAVILYNTLTSSSGGITVSGGTGGASDGSGDGGGGGAGISTNGTTGNTNGAGGAGGAGESLVALNTVF